MLNQWRNTLVEEYKKGPVDASKFTTEHFNEIDSSTRKSKLQQVKKLLSTLDKLSSSGREVSLASAEEYSRKPDKICENLLPNVSTATWDPTHRVITIGIMGDTQLGSKYAQITYLHEFYDICKKLGIKDVYHTGDITDGERMRPGHAYECYVQGADAHVNEIVQNYPKVEGITTHFITGNHDASFMKLCGMDIGNIIEIRRPDMKYLGRDQATVNITPNVSLMLRHPWDGSCYALSYKPQKMIEAMDEYNRPTILAIGHYHKMEYLYYLGVHCFQTGCYQSSTPFTIGKGIRVSMGGWIVSITVDKDGNPVSIVPRDIVKKEPIKDDYLNYRR